ncbi:hypothetical protein FE257_008669 [Aspergillus nanangensis]|uniref:BZIP domain-containing protein n=1 Tax=Aspergillus nanangensis TaxID=2582783 RepID=A0AAD4CL18_ASPNN|nr:hypothetical protein FE257_008669 [Aspergillus nanangensis]
MEGTQLASQEESYQTSPVLVKNLENKVKRRSQNREAQRRFRERRVQQQKSIQQEMDELRTECQRLRDQDREMSRLVKDNDKLRSELMNLRQQRRMMLAILGRPRNSQSTSAGDDLAFLDMLRCCLEFTEEKSPSTPDL